MFALIVCWCGDVATDRLGAETVTVVYEAPLQIAEVEQGTDSFSTICLAFTKDYFVISHCLIHSEQYLVTRVICSAECFHTQCRDDPPAECFHTQCRDDPPGHI